MACKLLAGLRNENKMGTLPFATFATMEEGYAACAESGRGFPFVVRACAGFEATTEAAVRGQLGHERDIKGYTMSGGTQHLSGREALRKWDNSSLECNVVDSASTRGHTALLPAALAAISRDALVPESLWLAYVLSPEDLINCGALHIDPPYGSGWQYLARGRKHWYALDHAAFSLADYEAAHGCPPPPPIMHTIISKHSVVDVVIGPGDFVSCPAGWPHAVATLEASIGLSGYTAAVPA